MRKELRYDKILIILKKILPPKWHSVVLFVLYEGNSFIMKYYFKTNGKGKYQDGEKAEFVKKQEIIDVYLALDNEISFTRNNNNGNTEKWTTMALKYENRGDKFYAYFAYEDLKEKELVVLNSLKAKYID